jgi:hypothetical protein
LGRSHRESGIACAVFFDSIAGGVCCTARLHKNPSSTGSTGRPSTPWLFVLPRWGETIGAGLEFGFTPNWSIGFQYNHIFLDDRNITLTLAGAPVSTDRINQDVDIGLVSLNYRFGGPVIARNTEQTPHSNDKPRRSLRGLFVLKDIFSSTSSPNVSTGRVEKAGHQIRPQSKSLVNAANRNLARRFQSAAGAQ